MSSFFMAETASAQSTATAAVEVEQVVVTGRRGPRTIDGAMVAETVGKSRSSITQEFIETQAAGQTINEVLNLVPGMSFTNNDAYGSSGGNIRLRGFDGNRVSLTFDGIPLNDTGNYASYTNQQLDPDFDPTHQQKLLDLFLFICDEHLATQLFIVNHHAVIHGGLMNTETLVLNDTNIMKTENYNQHVVMETY